MNDERKPLRAEITLLQQDRDRLDSEVNLWRTRYFELLGQSLGTREACPPQNPGRARFQLSVVGSNPLRFISEGKNPMISCAKLRQSESRRIESGHDGYDEPVLRAPGA